MPSKRGYSSLAAFLYVAGFVVAFWLLWAICICVWGNLDRSGKFGDSFGFVNCLFTGLALIGIVIALHAQRSQTEQFKTSLEIQREQLGDLERGRRIGLSSTVQDHYFGIDFVHVRIAAWSVWDDYWKKAPNSRDPIIKYFFDDFDGTDPALPPNVKSNFNQLTPLQNLALFVNYWHRIALFNRRELVDPVLIEPLRHEFIVWRDFLAQLAIHARHYQEMRKKPPEMLPDWVAAVDELTRLFRQSA